MKNKFVKRFFHALAISLVLVPGSCSILKDSAKEPEVEILKVKVGEISTSSISFIGDLRITNTNPFDVPIDKVAYDLSINGNKLFSGETKEIPRLKANGSVDTSLKISIPASAIEAVKQIFLKDKGFSYEVSGAVTVLSLNLPFKKGGSLSLPSIKWGSPKISEANFSLVSIIVPVTLKNSNDFNWPAMKVDYDSTLSRTVFLSRQQVDIQALAPGQESVVDMPFSFSPASLGRALMKLLDSEEHELKVKGSLSTDFGAVSFEEGKTVKLPVNDLKPKGSGSAKPGVNHLLKLLGN